MGFSLFLHPLSIVLLTLTLLALALEILFGLAIVMKTKQRIHRLRITWLGLLMTFVILGLITAGATWNEDQGILFILNLFGIFLAALCIWVGKLEHRDVVAANEDKVRGTVSDAVNSVTQMGRS